MVAGERFRPQVSPFGIARRGEMILQKVAGGRAPFGGFAFHDLCLSFPAVGVDKKAASVGLRQDLRLRDKRGSHGKRSVKNRPAGPVFVAKLQHEVGKLVAVKHRLLPRRSGWIVSPQAADRRPLSLGSTRGGGPRIEWQAPDRKRIPRLKQLGLEV